MCDYSLENQLSRPAKVGDELVTTRFANTPTRGFCARGEPGVAVCLRPGTELAFAAPISHSGLWGLAGWLVSRTRPRTARFRQFDLDNPFAHHDALELDDGHIMLLASLRPGQRARVLQLPADPDQLRRDGHLHPRQKEFVSKILVSSDGT